MPAPKRQVRGVLKSMFRRKSSEPSPQVGNEYKDVVEELYEEGSAILSERYVFVKIYEGLANIIFLNVRLDLS